MAISCSRGSLILLKKRKILVVLFRVFINNSNRPSDSTENRLFIPGRELCQPSPSASTTCQSVVANAWRSALSACSGLNYGAKPHGNSRMQYLKIRLAIWWNTIWRVNALRYPDHSPKSRSRLRQPSSIERRVPGGQESRAQDLAGGRLGKRLTSDEAFIPAVWSLGPSLLFL
jgi:hypothetical protein